MSDFSNLPIVIIPAYEPPESFLSYAASLLPNIRALIVVDDGSGNGYSERFRKLKSMEGATVITHRKNCGKGAALKSAFRYVYRHYPAGCVAVTADCDGQHTACDILGVFRAAKRHGIGITLGMRDFTLPTVPERSRSGNRMSRRLLSLFYGMDVYDTQTGLRAFDVSLIPRLLTVKGERFEYETSVLIYAKRNQIPLYEVPIATVYPENPQEHISHFHTFRDTARVFGVILGNIGSFAFVSVLSALLDYLLFAFLFQWLFHSSTDALSLLAATVAARLLSSAFNFFLNCKTVFHGKAKRALLRYYALWFFQMATSFGLLYLSTAFFHLPELIIKPIVDIALSLIGYQIQCRWIYAEKPKSQRIFGPFARFLRTVSRIFSPKYRFVGDIPDVPSLYICRHLNMHGTITAIKWLPIEVHPMVLSVFFDRKSCATQYTAYTFTVRKGKPAVKHSFIAALSSIFSVSLVKSLRSVPVYRENSVKSVITFRKSLEVLRNGESLIIFPDKDYTGNYEKFSEIYDGFLRIAALYEKYEKKKLPLIPLSVNDRSRRLTSGEPLYYGTDGNTKKDVEDIINQCE